MLVLLLHHCRMKNIFPAPYSNSVGQGFGQGLLPRRLHTICRLWRTSSGEDKTGVFFNGDASKLLPDELDCLHSSRMFLLITNAAMLVITRSSALISLVCLDLFVTFAELPNMLLTTNRALFSRFFSFRHSTAPAPPVRLLPGSGSGSFQATSHSN